MKKIIFIIVIMIIISNIALAQSTGEPYDIDEPYDFPVKPGMPEWADLKTEIERINALQIPQDILMRITTRALVETCLNHPLFLSYATAFNIPTEGMEYATKNFNAFVELLKRKDAYAYLSKRFISFDPLAINEEWDLLEGGDYKFELMKIELLLAEDIVLESASYESKVLLLKEALLKYEKMLTRADFYFFYFSHRPLLFLMGKILQNSGNPDISSLVISNKGISIFLETGNLGSNNYDVINEILLLVNEIDIETININDLKEIPITYSLSQNYPNPFNPSTNFKYSVPKTSDVNIIIYDISGKEIKTLVNKSKEAGIYTITWNGRDNNNRQVSTGVYFYKMQADGFQKTMKMLLMK